MIDPREWERRLVWAVEAGDRAGLHRALGELRRELDVEEDLVIALQREPLLERLVEHARRLVSTDPTDEEALVAELIEERRLWSSYRERYRERFVPPALLPLLDGCAAFIRPAPDGVQYEGFEKYAGQTDGRRREAATLFVPTGEQAGAPPPNFFGAFDESYGRLVVRRCYRTVLPPGAGTACMIEQVRALVPTITQLEALAFENVQNRATYAAHVTGLGDTRRLREGVGIGDSPLGRLAARIFAGCGLAPGAPRPRLDTYGILDLEFPVG
jgi:hypothetical protein